MRLHMKKQIGVIAVMAFLLCACEMSTNADENVVSSSSLSVQKSSSSNGNLSSSVFSSSSTEASSSSSAEYLKDTRDGKVYKIALIGTQTWMAENLNYSNGDSIGVCDSSCDKGFGRLYDWETAMVEMDTLTHHQGICPEYWHIPTKADVINLIEFASDSIVDSVSYDGAYHLKGIDFGGIDVYGFNANPFLVVSEGGDAELNLLTAETSATDSSLYVYVRMTKNENTVYYTNTRPKTNAISVRCVRNFEALTLIEMPEPITQPVY